MKEEIRFPALSDAGLRNRVLDTHITMFLKFRIPTKLIPSGGFIYIFNTKRTISL